TVSTKGRNIIFLNLRDYNCGKIFLREILHRTSELLNHKDEPQLLLADFTGIPYTHNFFEITKQFVSKNLPNIKAAAFKGIHIEQEIDTDIIKKASQLHILFFSDLNEAKNWLSEK
ncbi:MAG: hypothetical protein PF518_17495, partial [Spirochaetaceae bacterium]|nr:hypothetical protein [Spirochaetaceae bacterium]